MVRAKFNMNTSEVEAEGDPSEVASFFKMLKEGNASLSSNFTVKREDERRGRSIDETILELKMKMPSPEQVRDVIRSRPNYSHTISDLQKHFFGTVFKSRDKTTSLWHMFRNIVVKAKEMIEKEERGRFIAKRAVRQDGQPISLYEFEPMVKATAPPVTTSQTKYETKSPLEHVFA